MNRLAIIGASGHGKVVADIAELTGWDEVVFFDDAWPEKTSIGPWLIKGNTEALLTELCDFQACFVAIGNNVVRWQKQNLLKKRGASFATLIHPTAVVSRYSSLGEGSVVMANAVINSFARLGSVNIINTSATVDHDCLLADAVHISPGSHLAGGVHVGNATWVGIGSTIMQLVHIGKNVVVGAGATVVNDIPDNLVVAGIPAKPLS